VAITHVFSGSGQAINGGGPSINLGTLQQGDVVVALAAASFFNGPVFSTSGYAVIFEDTFEGDDDVSAIVGWKRMGSSPDTSVVFSGLGSPSLGLAASAIVLRGVDPTTAIDAALTSTDGDSTNPDPPSITTVTPGAAVIAMMAAAVNDSSVTGPSGYGNSTSINANDTSPATTGAAWLLKAAAGAENPPAFTGVSSASWIAVTVALRPAPPAGNPWYYYAQLQ
jgi:hypothetical protein